MNVRITNKQEKYIASQIRSGAYKNASEVVRDALRLHEFYRQVVIQELRAEIAKGWDGPTSPRSLRDIIRQKQFG